MKYPNINDDDFYKKINRIYKKYKISSKKKTFDQICNPKKYELQLPQKFVAEFMNPNTPYTGILIYHKIGAGKTCAAIRICEKFKKHKKIVIVLPASLKGSFRSELLSQCTGETYIKNKERELLKQYHPTSSEYEKIIDKANERINRYYKIYSYNKFIEHVQNNEIRLNNHLLVIDEIQNMISEEGTYYTELLKLIKTSPSNLRLVLLSATPMFDKPNELGLTINLLRPPRLLPIGKDFDKKFIKTRKIKNSYKLSIKNIESFKRAIRGRISYFRGAPSYVFPELKIKYIKCEMSSFQYSSYKAILKNEEKNNNKIKKKVNKTLNVSELPNNFFMGTRYVSNIVFPNKLIGLDGLESLTKYKILHNLQMYSTKFFTMINKIKHSSGKIFIYSSFKEFGGLKGFTYVLDAYGYKDYSSHGEGYKRYALWTGDENIAYKDEIKTIYNLDNNINGSKLKIILGSSSIKEGINFKSVKQVHIIEPYWNKPRLDQVIGRASRFCSHKDLELDKRIVKVYIYLATYKNIETVDEYIYKLSMKKNELVNQFEKIIKQGAIDCYLNKNANVSDDDSSYTCDK